MGILKEGRRGKQKDQNDPLPCDPRVDRVGHTWTEPRVAHVAPTWDTWLAILANLALSRTRRVLRPFSGLRTLISNPSLDYES